MATNDITITEHEDKLVAESIAPVSDDARIFELWLHDDDTITIYAEGPTEVAALNYDLDEAKRIHAALGHLIWQADNQR